MPGAEEHAYALKFFNDAVLLHKKLHLILEEMNGPVNRKKHIVVVGGGFSGVETAGELACCLEKLCFDCNISPGDIIVTIVERSETILSSANERVVRIVQKRLRALGIRIIVGQKVTRVSEQHVELETRERIPSDLTIWATGVGVPKMVAEISGLEHGKRGRIIVDEYLRAKGSEYVFALGDNALYIDSKTDSPAPGTASIAIRQAPIVAENIFRALTGRSLKPYNLNFPGFVVPVGGRFVVAQIGNMVLTGFTARVLHQIITWKYYISVLPFARAFRMLIRGSRLFSQND